ncbi:MAG TPA: amidohydrolase family protein, partial [Thermoanaerobaculia bacterium]
LVALLFTTSVEASVTAVKNVRLFDGTKMIPSATVVFTGGVITSAGPSAKVPDGATVIDGSGKTLLPGLIDAHTHVFPGSLERALRFGVTTELDMFTSSELAQKLKAEQKNGEVTSRADLRSANILVTVAGGHGSEYFPIPVYVPGSDPQAFVDARIAEGSDFIKLIYDNGSAYGLSFNTLTKSDLAALIAAAHKRGKMAVVHISTLQFARDAIESGADGLAHIFNDVGPDAGFGKFVHTHRAFVVPTLSVNESASGVASGASLVSDARLQPYLTAAEMSSLKGSFPPRAASAHNLDNANAAVRQLKAAGVPILVGTDAPNPGTAHGASVHRELELLVKAGLTPVEALVAATSAPASAFHLTDRGRIAPKLRADLVLVNGDPTTDILATRDIVTVWKGGVPLERKQETKEAQAAVETIPADKLAAGVVSTFESGTPDAQIGSMWVISTDSFVGGNSTATMDVVDGGANGTAKSLHIHTDTKPGTAFPWAGAMIFLASTPMRPVDVSSKSGFSFFAKGDVDIRLMVFSLGAGRIPHMTTVHAGPEWTEITARWSDFGFDGKDIQAIHFAGPGSGTADFQIDELRLK